nr:unnamed protein product [Digitaria exilis]
MADEESGSGVAGAGGGGEAPAPSAPNGDRSGNSPPAAPAGSSSGGDLPRPASSFRCCLCRHLRPAVPQGGEGGRFSSVRFGFVSS